VSRSIGLVHAYISNLLTRICPDVHVRAQLWDTVLVEELRKTYIRAMEHARFLLRIERQGRPSTFNHYFDSEVQKRRQDCLKELTDTNIEGDKIVSVAKIRNMVVNKDNGQHMREDILDILMSYYKVTRKRFVDNVCNQVINHFLLEGDESPLKILSPELVMGLDNEQLELIAGEEAETRRQRQVSGSSIKELEAAMKILRV
jgi:hypothetical protein